MKFNQKELKSLSEEESKDIQIRSNVLLDHLPKPTRAE
jgi:hypothetical protein